jgi:myo-inositol 2-dehydrogenase/D-chiro-inositol 1-dehydrogenase
MKFMKKLALVGCGGIGQYHLGHILQFGDLVESVGFCDLILERAEKFAAQAGGKAYTDFWKMLDETNPDMVFLCVPPTEHGPMERELISRKIPFFVEKPIALNWDMAKEIADAIEEAGLITAVGFQCRYDLLADKLSAFAMQNEIVYINCTRFGGIPGQPWWKKKALSGGQLLEQTIHQLDYIRYTYGEPDTVFAMGARGFIRDVEGYDTDDVSAAVVTMESGALCNIATGCYVTGGEAYDSKLTYSAKDKRADLYLLSRLDIYGESGETEEVGDLVVKGDGSMVSVGKDKISYRHEGDAGIPCDRTFIEAVISGDDSAIRSPYRDALKSLAFALAYNESMETGKPAKVRKL